MPHTHNLAEPIFPRLSRHHWPLQCARARHRDGVDMPDAGLHPHRGRCTNNTQGQGHRAVCPSATHMSIRKRDRTKPGRNATTAAQTHGYQSTIWRGHTRSTTSPKKGKEGGTSAKGSVLILTCVPCLTSCCPCRGAPAQAPRQRQHEVRQGDTHDSGFAAIRGVPLSNQQRKNGDGPVRVNAIRLGRRSGLA